MLPEASLVGVNAGMPGTQIAQPPGLRDFRNSMGGTRTRDPGIMRSVHQPTASVNSELTPDSKPQGTTDVVFLWLPTADLAVARVQDRALRGGHNVPRGDYSTLWSVILESVK